MPRKQKTSLESELLSNTLRAAKKSKDPLRIASAFGILVDKIPKSRGKFRQEVEAAAKTLLKEIKRAANESNEPQQIATAFGILMDKQTFVHKDEKVELEKERRLTKAQRKREYKELLGK